MKKFQKRTNVPIEYHLNLFEILLRRYRNGLVFCTVKFYAIFMEIQVEADPQTKRFRLTFSQKDNFLRGFDKLLLPTEFPMEPLVTL